MQFHLCLCVVTKHNIQIAWRSPAHQSLQVPRAPCQVASYVCQPTNIPSQSALSGHNKRCAHNSNSVRFRKAVKGSGRRSQQRKQGLRKCKNNNVHSVAFHASRTTCAVTGRVQLVGPECGRPVVWGMNNEAVLCLRSILYSMHRLKCIRVRKYQNFMQRAESGVRRRAAAVVLKFSRGAAGGESCAGTADGGERNGTHRSGLVLKFSRAGPRAERSPAGAADGGEH